MKIFIILMVVVSSLSFGSVAKAQDDYDPNREPATSTETATSTDTTSSSDSTASSETPKTENPAAGTPAK